MQLRWGGYAFDDNEVWIQAFARRVYSPRGRRIMLHRSCVVGGVKIGTSESDLTAKLQALEAACNIDGNDLIFYDNSGNPTVHVLTTSGSLNGVQVKQPVHYPGPPVFWGMGTEYVYKRTYRVTFEADYLSFDDNLVSSYETITKIGTGGQSTVYQESFYGVPQLQIPKLYTKCRLIQQGRAVGLTSYPTPSTPLYGDPFIQNDRTQLILEKPLYQNIYTMTHYPVRWAYFYESPTPL